jgi:hypothetical protein
MDSRGTEVPVGVWCVCVPRLRFQWALKIGQPKAISTLDCRDPPNFPKVAQSQASFSQAAWLTGILRRRTHFHPSGLPVGVILLWVGVFPRESINPVGAAQAAR